MCTMLHFEIGQRVRYTFFWYTAFTENQDNTIYPPKYWYAWALVSKKSRDTPGIKTGLYNVQDNGQVTKFATKNTDQL